VELRYNPKEPTSKKGIAREMFLPWAGYFPHPELDKGIEPPPWPVSQEVQQALDALPAIPLTVKFIIPNGISLAEFRRHKVEYGQVPLEVVQQHVAGLSGTLAPRKPLDGVYAFVWRCARYHSGLDANIPVTAFWDLEDGITHLTGTRGGATEEVVGFLEQKAQELIAGEKNVAILRWARITGRID
jgi:hypothetical protein